MVRVRLAGIAWQSVVDGPGVRAVVFAQGCPHDCPGCHNPHALDPEGGQWHDLEELAGRLSGYRGLRGVTFSGGEPFLQAGALAALAVRVKACGLDVVTFSGFTYEELCLAAATDPASRALLQESDLLIDGPYVQEERDLSLAFRGSRNQRVIDLAATREAGGVVLSPWHFR